MSRKKSDWLSARGKSEELFSGIVNAVLARGGSDKDLDRVRNSPVHIGQIADVIMNSDIAAAQAYRLFGPVLIGLMSNHEHYCTALKEKGFKCDDYAKQILTKTYVSYTSHCLDLVVLTTKEITGKDGATREEIYETALDRGDVDLCPAEVGPALRLQYFEQPQDERLIIAMEPITDLDGNARLFCVLSFSLVRWLYSLCDFPGDVYEGDNRWLFVRRN